MKTKLLLSFLLLAITYSVCTAQIQKGFTYQAVARDATGHSIINTPMPVRLSILGADSSTVIWQEQHSITTNSFGLINVVLGKGSRVTGVAKFSDIDWTVGPKFIKTEIFYPSTWLNMGYSRFWSVPYALLADMANGVNPGSKLSVTQSSSDPGVDALFEVKRKDGQTVFAVYPDAVNIYVPRSGKGAKGGFAVGGFDGSKLGPQDYFRVTPDSVRIYIDPTPGVKGTKGGFAVGGYDQTKGINSMYFNLTPATAVNTVSSSNQVLWYPVKNAFLAGNIHIFHIDSVGNYSTALGYQSSARGDYSQAFGYKAIAAGNYSTSIGKRSVAGVYKSKHNAFALGNGTQALGEDSYAFGSAARATGPKSFAFGSVAIDSSGHVLTTPTTASGDYSTAIGMGAQATGTGALAFGNSSVSSGYASMALGFYSTVLSSANYGTAIGYLAQSSGYSSVSMGIKSYAQGSGSMAIGAYAKTGSTATNAGSFGYNTNAMGPYSVSVGPYSTTGSTANYAGSFGYSADALAPNSVAIGYNAQVPTTGTSAGSFGLNASAAGPYSISIGPYTTTGSTANYAGAFGYHADALAPNSVAIGYNAQTASGATSAGAFGNGAIASGVSSVAVGPGALTGTGASNAASFGFSASANGQNSVAIGNGATTGASALDASALGKLANASGSSSMALGISASSIGASSIAIGNNSIANAPNSTSFGTNTSTAASALYSTALGYGSTTAEQYATALGYNAQANGAKSVSIGAYYDYWYLRPTFYIDPITHRITIKYISTHITKNNVAKDDYSVAIGNGNESSKGGFTFGANNYARSVGAIALGHSNSADSSYSLAAGYSNNATGIGAFAMGENITAQSFHSFVVGSMNLISGTKDEWVATDPLFVVGNGTSSRSNAFVVDKSGNTTVSGNLTVNGTITGYSGGDGLGTHNMTQNLRTNGYYISNDGGNEGLWVSTAGAVGIGNAAPSYMLDVSGSFRSGGSMVASSNLYTYGTIYSYGNLNVSGNMYSTTINPDNNANLTIDAGTLYVDGTNNRIGVNNTAPAYGLDVTGTFHATSSGYFGADVYLTSASPAFYFTDNTTGEDDFKFEANADALVISTQGKTPVNVLGMSSTGAVAMPSIGTGTGTALVWNSTLGQVLRNSSSMKYKTDINILDDYSWLFDLKPVDFLYKSDTEKQRQYGLIAEDVAKINNNLVFYKDGEPDAINYNGLVAPLIKAVQDQKKTIESLKADNESLKLRLEKLESILNSLTQGQK